MVEVDLFVFSLLVYDSLNTLDTYFLITAPSLKLL